MPTSRKKKKPTNRKPKIDQTSSPPVRILRVRKGATLKEIYAKVRATFTAADLQRYTQDEPMVPADEVIRELEAMLPKKKPKRKSRRAS
jgi:hypothetical protein